MDSRLFSCRKGPLKMSDLDLLRYHRHWRDVELETTANDDEWIYTCVDLLKGLSDHFNPDSVWAIDTSKRFNVEWIRIPFNWNTPLPPLLDEVRLLKQPLNIQRVHSGLPDNSMLLSGINVCSTNACCVFVDCYNSSFILSTTRLMPTRPTPTSKSSNSCQSLAMSSISP